MLRHTFILKTVTVDFFLNIYLKMKLDMSLRSANKTHNFKPLAARSELFLRFFDLCE